MEYSLNDFRDTLTFIKAYRNMEQRSLKANFEFIKSVVDKSQSKHLCDSWAGRNNDFGSFFLNLSHPTQASFIKKFGIEVPGLQQYLMEAESSPSAYTYITPPFIVSQLHELLKFFYNTGIHQNAVPGIKIQFLPEECYGNSTNWGNYILSLTEPDQRSVLQQIAFNSLDNIQQADNNRLFMKNALSGTYH